MLTRHSRRKLLFPSEHLKLFNSLKFQADDLGYQGFSLVWIPWCHTEVDGGMKSLYLNKDFDLKYVFYAYDFTI